MDDGGRRSPFESGGSPLETESYSPVKQGNCEVEKGPSGRWVERLLSRCLYQATRGRSWASGEVGFDIRVARLGASGGKATIGRSGGGVRCGSGGGLGGDIGGISGRRGGGSRQDRG